MVEMKDSRYGYGGGGDVGRKQMRCGTTDMEKWVVRTDMDFSNIDRDQLLT